MIGQEGSWGNQGEEMFTKRGQLCLLSAATLCYLLKRCDSRHKSGHRQKGETDSPSQTLTPSGTDNYTTIS